MTAEFFIKKCLLILVILLVSGKSHAGYYEEGCGYYNYKKYDKAKEMFLKSIEINDDGNSYYFLGEIEKNTGNFDSAIEYYKISIGKNMTAKYRRLAYWNIIVIEEQKGRYSDMVIICREVWEKMGDAGAKKKVESLINKFIWSDSEEAKVLYKDGIEYKKKNMPDKAKELFSNSLRIDSDFLASKFELGLLYLNENNNQAINYFKEIAEKIPFYGEVQLLLGNIYYNNQSYMNSIEYFGQALQYGFLDNKTKYSIQLKTGTSYYEIGDYEKAQEEFKIAAELNHKAVEPLLLLSAIYIKKNNFEQALAYLLKAKELNHNNLEINFQIGSLYYKTNDQRYVNYFNLLFNKFSTGKEEVPQKYYKSFVLLLKYDYENKKYREALKIIEFLPEAQKNYEINLMYARSNHYLDKHDKAIEYFEKLSLNNDDKYLLCISYSKTGMTEKARNILENLSNTDDYLEKAKSNDALMKIAYDIINDRIKREEERKNKEAAEKRRIEEERVKAEKENQKKLQDQSKPNEPGKGSDINTLLRKIMTSGVGVSSNSGKNRKACFLI